MLVTLSEILQLAEAKKCAVGSFNTPNLESIMAVIGAAEELAYFRCLGCCFYCN